MSMFKRQSAHKLDSLVFGSAKSLLWAFLWINCFVISYVAPVFARAQDAGATATLRVPFEAPFETTLDSSERERRGRVFDELSFSATQESYLDRNQPPAGITDYSVISAGLRTRTDQPNFNGVLEFSGSFATSVENYSNFELPQANLNWVIGSKADRSHGRVIFGRHLESWSRLDSDWKLGIWQPLNRFDYLRPHEQGLTGVFAGWKHEGFEALLFYSSIYIPEQGPSYELQNGTFRTNNPWFSPPTDTLVLFSKSTRVNYTVEMPAVGSVISQQSFGALVRAATPGKKGAYFQGAGMHKPRNQIALPFSGRLQIEPDNHYASVNVFPQVEYHTVGSIDFGYREPTLGFGFTALTEVPSTPHIRGDLNYQILGPMTMISPYAEVRMFPSRFWGPRVRVSALHTFDGETKVEGPLTSNSSVFAPRTVFREAGSVAVDTTLSRGTWGRLEHSFQWIEEFAEQGTVLMTELRLFMGENWRMNLAADVLGSRQPIDQTHDFISRYRGNDRVSGGVGFVF